MILSGISIKKREIINPTVEKSRAYGMSYGLGYGGYDIRIEQQLVLFPGEFMLGSTVEEFDMDNDILGVVHDKSSWARQGLSVFNTVIEPGWKGFLTLELSNRSKNLLRISPGHPIAQVIFHLIDQPVEVTYDGKYQNAKQGPQEAILT